jgi:hypothetical protein
LSKVQKKKKSNTKTFDLPKNGLATSTKRVQKLKNNYFSIFDLLKKDGKNYKIFDLLKNETFDLLILLLASLKSDFRSPKIQPHDHSPSIIKPFQ